MTRIAVNATDLSTSYVAAPWNNYSDVTLGIKVADCLDLDTAAATGVAYEVTDAPTDTVSATAASSSPNGWPTSAWNKYHYGTMAAKFTNLNPGDAYTLYLGGQSGDIGRDTNFTVDGITKLYDVTSATAPAPPVEFTGTVPANGEVAFQVAGVQSFAYFSAVEIITLPGVAIKETAVADDKEIALPSPLTADYSIHDTATGALVGQKGTVTITGGAFMIADSALANGTQYDLRLRLPDGSRDRSVRVTAQST